jgi:hypothetical protein
MQACVPAVPSLCARGCRRVLRMIVGDVRALLPCAESVDVACTRVSLVVVVHVHAPYCACCSSANGGVLQSAEDCRRWVCALAIVNVPQVLGATVGGGRVDACGCCCGHRCLAVGLCPMNVRTLIIALRGEQAVQLALESWTRGDVSDALRVASWRNL